MKMLPCCKRLVAVPILLLVVQLVISCAAFREKSDSVADRIALLKHQEEQRYQSAQQEKERVATNKPSSVAIEEVDSISMSGGIDLHGQEPSGAMVPNTGVGSPSDHADDAQKNAQMAHNQTIPPPTISEEKEKPDELTPRSSLTVLRVTPVEQTIAIGHEMNLQIEVQNVSDLYSSPFYLLFDPNLFEFVALQEGEFLKRDGKNTILLKSVDATEGRIIVGLSRLGKVGGVSGSGVLLTATFKSKQTGAGSFSFHKLEFVNSALSPLPVVSQNGVIRVKG